MPDHFHGLFWFDVEKLETKAPPPNGVGSGLSRTNNSILHGEQDKPAPTLSLGCYWRQDTSVSTRENAEIEYPDKTHNLLSKDAPLNISKIMHRIKGRTAIEIRNELHINFKWQQYFYDFNIYTRKKYLEKLNYIHNNQYKDKSILAPDTYPYSSMTFLETGVGALKIDEIDL